MSSRKTSLSHDTHHKQLILYNELADRFKPQYGKFLGYSELAKAFEGDKNAFKKLFEHVLAVLWHSFYKNGQHMKDYINTQDIKWATLFLGFVPTNYRICFREDNINFLVLGEVLTHLHHEKYDEVDDSEKTEDKNNIQPIDVLENIVNPVFHDDPFYNILETWYHEQMDQLHHERVMLGEIKRVIYQIQNYDL